MSTGSRNARSGSPSGAEGTVRPGSGRGGTSTSLTARIDALLPQTQCRQCGFDGCRPYAAAIAEGRADIDQCPPGGETGVRTLAGLLEREPKPVNRDHGEVKDQATVVWIDESVCIGCTKCLQACPVDAIVGAAQRMHTVIRAECTGCDLCIEPCPVDCIHPVPVAPPAGEPFWHDPARARDRFERRQERLTRRAESRAARRQQRRAAMRERPAGEEDPRKARIQAALAKARARKRSNDEGKR